ncbi:MAG: hypothetical protein HUJ54_04105 [Erysipelotrichaceae bacterium]|nr:hypothetical protein [Erysipelotrichaceae bacterium]
MKRKFAKAIACLMASLSMMSAAFVPTFAEEIQQEEQTQANVTEMRFPKKTYTVGTDEIPEVGEQVGKYNLIPGDLYVCEPDYASTADWDKNDGEVERYVILVLDAYEEDVDWFGWFTKRVLTVIDLRDGEEIKVTADRLYFFKFNGVY